MDCFSMAALVANRMGNGHCALCNLEKTYKCKHTCLNDGVRYVVFIRRRQQNKRAFAGRQVGHHPYFLSPCVAEVGSSREAS